MIKGFAAHNFVRTFTRACSHASHRFLAFALALLLATACMPAAAFAENNEASGVSLTANTDITLASSEEDGSDEPEESVLDKTVNQVTDDLSKQFTSNDLSSNTITAAYALQATEQSTSLDSNAIFQSLKAEAYLSAGKLAQYIAALTAAGIDCTQITDNGTKRNLLEELETMIRQSTPSVYELPYILTVYNGYGYTAPQEIIDTLLNASLETQNSETSLCGSTYDGVRYEDTQTTAQLMLALSSYTTSEDTDSTSNTISGTIKKSISEAIVHAIDAAENALLDMQTEDGGFKYASYSTAADADTTASIVTFLTARGYDCSGAGDNNRLLTKSGASPLSYLMAMAQQGYPGSYNTELSAATVFLATASYQGFVKNDRQAYNLFNQTEKLPTLIAASFVTPVTPNKTNGTSKPNTSKATTPRNHANSKNMKTASHTTKNEAGSSNNQEANAEEAATAVDNNAAEESYATVEENTTTADNSMGVTINPIALVVLVIAIVALALALLALIRSRRSRKQANTPVRR